MSCAKTAEPIEMPAACAVDSDGPTEPFVNWGAGSRPQTRGWVPRGRGDSGSRPASKFSDHSFSFIVATERASVER